jgi:ABC-type cobalamin transport system ATPase subunit
LGSSYMLGMAIDYRISKIVIRRFRGIHELELDLRPCSPLILVGPNNAGKSTVLHAVALALNGGGYHQWSPTEMDFFHATSGEIASDFLVQVIFESSHELGFPAVKGVGKPIMVHGVQVKGRRTRDGRFSHTRTLLDSEHQPITIATRTPLAADDKDRFSDHDVDFRRVNARLDDIRDHTPEVWFFQPKNIEASLYLWKTGPLMKLSKLLAAQFLGDDWAFKSDDGREWKMPSTVKKAHAFLRDAVEAFPFWTKDMKPRLERIFASYVGTHSKIDLKPDILAIEEWLARQLQVSLATDDESAPTPLQNMGDGWQSVIRLAALEAVSEYPAISKDRTVLLLEEPETHLHPHLRRKMRKVLKALAEKGWTIICATHSPEMVSLSEPQIIARLVRSKGKVQRDCLDTRVVEDSAKLQSKLDERGAHDFLFGARAVFCEGRDDSFALSLALEKKQIDYDARSVSITQCGSVTAVPAFTRIAGSLGIRWCALTDEDTQQDGTVKPKTAAVRQQLTDMQKPEDTLVEWPGDLERSLDVTNGKATPEVSTQKLSDPNWEAAYPGFSESVQKVAGWIVA